MGCSKDKGEEQPPQSATKPANLSQAKIETDALDRAHRTTAQKLINDGLQFLLKQRDK